MPVVTVNGHVLLPHYPDWKQPVQRQRLWQTGVDRALSGMESRLALRPAPRERLTFRLESQSPDELARLTARVDAALQAGLACAPHWGSGIPLTSAGGKTVQLTRNAWAGVAAGWVLFFAEPAGGEAFELAEVASVAGNTITLVASLVGVWGAGHWVWPLVFGRVSFGAIQQRTDWHAAMTVTITEISALTAVGEGDPDLPQQVPDGISFDWWLGGAPVSNPGTPTTITFEHWLSGAPVR